MDKQKENKENAFVMPKEAYFIRCPYDHRHFVLSRSYEAHVKNCASVHPQVEMLFCPFNTTHRCRSLEQLVRFILRFEKENFRSNFIELIFVLQSQHIEKCPFQESFGHYKPKDDSR